VDAQPSGEGGPLVSDSREQILGRVKAALKELPERAPLPDWYADLVVLREARGVTDAWALFAERMKLVNGTPLTSAAELVKLLDGKGWRRGYCDPELLPTLKPAFPDSFKIETSFDRTRVDDYDFGITRATGAIAETGTLILSEADTPTRLAALAPWVHVAAIRRDQIYVDIPHAVSSLPADPNIIWCTGPSKTADVEGILIEGVHGPGMQIALLV
jgi:L-lactate dehydrogenase complex protein LldG